MSCVASSVGVGDASESNERRSDDTSREPKNSSAPSIAVEGADAQHVGVTDTGNGEVADSARSRPVEHRVHVADVGVIASGHPWRSPEPLAGREEEVAGHDHEVGIIGDGADTRPRPSLEFLAPGDELRWRVVRDIAR